MPDGNQALFNSKVTAAEMPKGIPMGDNGLLKEQYGLFF